MPLKILWIEDRGTSKHTGGAIFTNNTMIQAGLDRGHEITTISSSEEKLLCSELIILDNIARFDTNFIRQIVNFKDYIKYEHDYDSLKRIEEVPDLFNNSLCNIFLSPLHKKQYDLINNNETFMIPSPVDTELFKYSKGWKNEGLWVAANAANPAKGFTNFIRYAKQHPKMRFKVYGHVKPKGLNLPGMAINLYYYYMNALCMPSNCYSMGYLPYDRMPHAFRVAERLVFLPNWKEPFGRVVAEASLSGCKIVGNDNIGFSSWNWKNYRAAKNAMRDAPKNFWKIVEKHA